MILAGLTTPQLGSNNPSLPQARLSHSTDRLIAKLVDCHLVRWPISRQRLDACLIRNQLSPTFGSISPKPLS